MSYAPVWHHRALTTSVFLLQFVSGVLCLEKVSNFYCQDNPDDSNLIKPLKNCVAAIHSGKLHVRCNVYATSSLKLPLFTNTTAAILLTDSMETFQDIDDVLTQPSNSSCLKLISIQIRKLNSADSEIAKHSNQFICIIPKKAFFPLMLIRQMDLLTVFNSDYAVGIVRYNKTCLQVANNLASGRTNHSISVDVSNCITSTDVRKFLTAGNKFSFPANMTMEELFSKDFLSVSFVVMAEIFFEGYNYSIPSAAFKTELFKYLPTESLTILSLKNVRNVEFQSNSIVSIRNGDIPLMESLRTLNLKDCKIELIEAKAFNGLVHLRELNLQSNNLKELSDAFHTLCYLNVLNLQSNGDRETSEFRYWDDILVTQTDLQSVDLSNMILSDFWKNFGNFSKLEYLNLSNCSLDYIPSANISYFMPNLIYLNLSRNNLTDVSILAFSGLNKLQFLDLSRNGLVYVPYNVIIDILPALELLSLDTNKILDFLPLKLEIDSTLQSLDLSFNRINSWNTTRINSSIQFLNVNLIGNNITEANSHMISDFTALKHVQLAENPFDCKSCTLKKFLAWIKLKNSSTDFSKTPYTCFFPKEYFKKIIANVTLESCQEETFDWISNVVIPSMVIVALLGSAAVAAIIYRWHLLYFVYLFQSKIGKYKRHNDGIVFKYDAFVSYCSADRNWVVEYLIPAVEFEEPKLHLCVHERDFEIGETIMNNVIECIDCSHKSIFVMSKRFIKSQWCQWELQMAQHKLFEDKRDVLILIMLGEISARETPKILKRLISKRTYLQWPINENCHRLFWKRLKDAIGKCQCLKH